MKTIVISAVNLVEAGTLVILRECLAYLSELNRKGQYRIIAVVYKRELADYPNIEYIETQWPKKKWVNRLWFEYVSMEKISKDLAPVYLWVSLHDTTPTVFAERRVVYCHNSFSFYKWKLKDWIFAPKIAAFALFTKYIYQKNIGKNNYLVVQQNWFREGMAEMFSLDREKIIVAPPKAARINVSEKYQGNMDCYSFIFPASPNSHKNFEIICKAAELVEKQIRTKKFKVFLTLSGNENTYARWLKGKWAKRLSSVDFMGFVTREDLFNYYAKCDCLLFPSKVESWGLPISEFKVYDKPMLLANLPYAHEAAAEATQVSFFNPDQADVLAEQMIRLIKGDSAFLKAAPKLKIKDPVTRSWEELFEFLLAE